MNRRFLATFYIAPVLIWMGIIFAGSTRIGSSDNSLRILYPLLSLFSENGKVGLTAEAQHMINIVFRKCAHVSEYAVLTLLTIRAIQQGATRLKPVSLEGGSAIGVLFACSDELHQWFVPSRTPALRDVMIDSVGVFGVVVVVSLFFGYKSLERTLWKSVSDSEPPEPLPDRQPA